MTLDQQDPKKIGGFLYELRVTGPRAYKKGDKKGACHDDYPHNYLCLNAAIGADESDVRKAVERLDKALKQAK